MSEVGILGNTAQHSEFRYKKTSVSVNPKYKERKKTTNKQKKSIACKCKERNLKTL